MRIKSRYRADKDLYEYSENNVLYELVKLYGAYIEYTSQINEGSFIAFYDNAKDRVLYRYINLANNEIKNYLLGKRILISSRKLRRLITTEKNSFVYSYSWLPLYIKYVIDRIFENEILKKYVLNNILSNCICSRQCLLIDDKESEIWICKKILLGFQFNFLEMVKENYSERKSRVAESVLNEIDIIKIVDTCMYQ